GTGQGGSTAAIHSLLHGLEGDVVPLELDPPELADRRVKFDARERMRRTVEQLQNHCQTLAKTAVFRRAEYWKDADASSLEKWTESCRPYRARFREEFIGEMPAAAESPAPRTRLRLETPKWRGYDVLLDVWPGVEAYGMLLVPKDLKPGERRSVVVAQHGRAGKPIDVVNPDQDTPAYHSFGAKLADQGFIVLAPQNLYLGEEIYRQLQRKATPLKTTFFGPMVRQHEQILKWLSSLPFVDERRIAFYGLSYGGKSAMLLPAAIEKYSLSICSGDFNEEVWKHVSVDDRFSFMFTLEHDHSEFDAADTYNYAEIAGGLIAPRPFMVERGHRDGVAPDEWVAYEFAKVRRRYVELGIGDRATLEFFPGGHEIRLQAALEMLRKYKSLTP
ncbi:MAG TPA: dienelactone hydrolase family protein, partial [Pirellulaceae bacterium]|nr:dienelactone hydrolase family protein [Pirellulaceae bacterium]